ncbi:MAG: proton-conducting transporter membrane subunit [Cytophagaceae bacterium]
MNQNDLNSILLIAPVIFPLMLALALYLVQMNVSLLRVVNMSGALVMFGICLSLFITVNEQEMMHVQIGGWSAPFGITFVADMFSGLMILFTGLLILCTAFYSLGGIDSRREKFGYYSLLNIMYAGVCGSVLTGDIFNLYVWFEVMLIASFVLLALGSTRVQLEGTIKYLAINVISSFIFLAGIGFLYGIAGTLNMADLSVVLSNLSEKNVVFASAMFFTVSFGIKAGLFPLFFWLPASYHTPPPVVSAIFTGLLTKVGVYALMRLYTTVYKGTGDFVLNIYIIIACLTMVVGVLGAIAQNDPRRILSFHIISQIGYMFLGLAVFTTFSLAGGIFYMFHNILAKTNLFLITGVVEKLGSEISSGYKSNLYSKFPLLAVLFLISAFSLAGLPPSSGFWAKFTLIKATFDDTHFAAGGIALFVGLMTLFSMLKIWLKIFWGKGQGSVINNPEGDTWSFTGIAFHNKIAMLIPITVIAILIIFLGLHPDWLYTLSLRSSDQLMHPEIYSKTILGR